MKLRNLEQLVQQYDDELSKIFCDGDSPQIAALKKYIESLKAAGFSGGSDIVYADFAEHTAKIDSKIDLSEKYLSSNELGASIFRSWRGDFSLNITLEAFTPSFKFDAEPSQLSSAVVPSTSLIDYSIFSPKARGVESPEDYYDHFLQNILKATDTKIRYVDPPRYPTAPQSEANRAQSKEILEEKELIDSAMRAPKIKIL